MGIYQALNTSLDRSCEVMAFHSIGVLDADIDEHAEMLVGLDSVAVLKSVTVHDHGRIERVHSRAGRRQKCVASPHQWVDLYSHG